MSVSTLAVIMTLMGFQLSLHVIAKQWQEFEALREELIAQG